MQIYIRYFSKEYIREKLTWYLRVSTGGAFCFPFLNVWNQINKTITKTRIKAPIHIEMAVIRFKCLSLSVSSLGLRKVDVVNGGALGDSVNEILYVLLILRMLCMNEPSKLAKVIWANGTFFIVNQQVGTIVHTHLSILPRTARILLGTNMPNK